MSSSVMVNYWMLNRHGILHSGISINEFSSKLKCTVSSMCSQTELDKTRKSWSQAMQDLKSKTSFSVLKRFSTGMLIIFELNTRSLTRKVHPDVLIIRK